MPSGIELRSISKSFGSVDAVRELSLEVPAGSLFAFLGTNGAGKSTTVRILSTLLQPSSGAAFVAGFDVTRHPHRVRQQIGVVPDFPVLFDPLTPRENLRRLGALRGLPRRHVEARIVDLSGALDLDRHLDQPVSTLSHGTRKKSSLAAAMLHAPAVLLLDEPFEGVDPVATDSIRALLATLRTRGVTVFITSHVLPLVQTFATHAAILHQGELRAAGTLTELIGAADDLESAFLAEIAGESRVPALDWYAP